MVLLKQKLKITWTGAVFLRPECMSPPPGPLGKYRCDSGHLGGGELRCRAFQGMPALERALRSRQPGGGRCAAVSGWITICPQPQLWAQAGADLGWNLNCYNDQPHSLRKAPSLLRVSVCSPVKRGQ